MAFFQSFMTLADLCKERLSESVTQFVTSLPRELTPSQRLELTCRVTSLLNDMNELMCSIHCTAIDFKELVDPTATRFYSTEMHTKLQSEFAVTTELVRDSDQDRPPTSSCIMYRPMCTRVIPRDSFSSYPPRSPQWFRVDSLSCKLAPEAQTLPSPAFLSTKEDENLRALNAALCLREAYSLFGYHRDHFSHTRRHHSTDYSFTSMTPAHEDIEYHFARAAEVLHNDCPNYANFPYQDDFTVKFDIAVPSLGQRTVSITEVGTFRVAQKRAYARTAFTLDLIRAELIQKVVSTPLSSFPCQNTPDVHRDQSQVFKRLYFAHQADKSRGFPVIPQRGYFHDFVRSVPGCGVPSKPAERSTRRISHSQLDRLRCIKEVKDYFGFDAALRADSNDYFPHVDQPFDVKYSVEYNARLFMIILNCLGGSFMDEVMKKRDLATGEIIYVVQGRYRFYLPQYFNYLTQTSLEMELLAESSHAYSHPNRSFAMCAVKHMLLLEILLHRDRLLEAIRSLPDSVFLQDYDSDEEDLRAEMYFEATHADAISGLPFSENWRLQSHDFVDRPSFRPNFFIPDRKQAPVLAVSEECIVAGRIRNLHRSFGRRRRMAELSFYCDHDAETWLISHLEVIKNIDRQAQLNQQAQFESYRSTNSTPATGFSVDYEPETPSTAAHDVGSASEQEHPFGDVFQDDEGSDGSGMRSDDNDFYQVTIDGVNYDVINGEMHFAGYEFD